MSLLVFCADKAIALLDSVLEVTKMLLASHALGLVHVIPAMTLVRPSGKAEQGFLHGHSGILGPESLRGTCTSSTPAWQRAALLAWTICKLSNASSHVSC